MIRRNPRELNNRTQRKRWLPRGCLYLGSIEDEMCFEAAGNWIKRNFQPQYLFKMLTSAKKVQQLHDCSQKCNFRQLNVAKIPIPQIHVSALQIAITCCLRNTKMFSLCARIQQITQPKSIIWILQYSVLNAHSRSSEANLMSKVHPSTRVCNSFSHFEAYFIHSWYARGPFVHLLGLPYPYRRLHICLQCKFEFPCIKCSKKLFKLRCLQTGLVWPKAGVLRLYAGKYVLLANVRQTLRWWGRLNAHAYSTVPSSTECIWLKSRLWALSISNRFQFGSIAPFHSHGTSGSSSESSISMSFLMLTGRGQYLLRDKILLFVFWPGAVKVVLFEWPCWWEIENKTQLPYLLLVFGLLDIDLLLHAKFDDVHGLHKPSAAALVVDAVPMAVAERRFRRCTSLRPCTGVWKREGG